MSETPVELARRLVDAFESAGIPYALGGALAFNQYGPPRATKDVDLNVFLGASEVGRVCRVLASSALTFDPALVQHAADEGANAEAWAGHIRVDLFFNSIPLHESASRRIRALPLLGRLAWTLSAEDLVVLKLLFFRGKDLVDVEHLVGLQREALDRRYIRQWLVDCVGESDSRVSKWDEISEALPPNPL